MKNKTPGVQPHFAKRKKVFPALAGLGIFIFLCLQISAIAQVNSLALVWPKGKKIAVSLTFDDARESQVTAGTALLDQYGVKATFFVVPAAVEQQVEGWKVAVANGHEIGNHTLSHPCTGNFWWSRSNALEDYSLERMNTELTECNTRIRQLLNVDAEVFAYPCGQKFVGRGTATQSYVPLIAKMFIAGRGWMDEAPNDPVFCNYAQLTGIEMDGKDFKQILPLLDEAKPSGQWVVLAGHEMGDSGVQTTRMAMLKELMIYAQNPANGIWLQPLGTVVKYLKRNKK